MLHIQSHKNTAQIYTYLIYYLPMISKEIYVATSTMDMIPCNTAS